MGLLPLADPWDPPLDPIQTGRLQSTPQPAERRCDGVLTGIRPRRQAALACRFDSVQEVGGGANEESRDKVTNDPGGYHQERDEGQQGNQNFQQGPYATNASAIACCDRAFIAR